MPLAIALQSIAVNTSAISTYMVICIDNSLLSVINRPPYHHRSGYIYVKSANAFFDNTSTFS